VTLARAVQPDHVDHKGSRETQVRLAHVDLKDGAVQSAHAGPKGSRETRVRLAHADLKDGVVLKGHVVQLGPRVNPDRLGQPARQVRLVRLVHPGLKDLPVHVGLKDRRDTAVQQVRVGQLGLRATPDRVARWASVPALWFT
jgi:hypothetical protein